jgi:hypothetical protein
MKKRRPPHRDPRIALRLIEQARQRQAWERQQREPLDADQLRDLGIGYHGALASMTRGTGTEDDCNTLACAANIALILCEKDLGAEYLEDVKRAQEVVVALYARRRANGGRLVLHALEIKALQALLEIHDAQLESPDCTAGLLAQVCAEVRRRMAEGEVFA